MNNYFLVKLFRILSAIFDSAFIYLIFFLYLLFPVNKMIDEYSVNNIISVDSIIILLCFIALGCITTFLYFFIFSLIFPCSTLGMKIFFLRFVKDDKSVLKRRILAKRYFILVLLFIFTLGLSLLSDIISIVLSEKGRTFSDQYFGLEVERLTLRKEY